MKSHILSESAPVPTSMLQEIANSGALDEISNAPGCVRHHIFWRCGCERTTNKLPKSVMFFIYDTTRHGPQNGFRLCIVHQGYHISSATKDNSTQEEDDIDRAEKEIPQGHMEVIILGERIIPGNLGLE